MYPDERIIQVAESLLQSNGSDAAGASTSELIAGALLAGHPEWAGYTTDGRTNVFAMIDRLGPEWCDVVRDLYQEFHAPGE